MLLLDFTKEIILNEPDS